MINEKEMVRTIKKCWKIFLRSFGIIGYKKTDNPPRWVMRKAYWVRWGGVDQYVKFKGKHYKYMVICVGHGQYDYYKKRRGK